MSGVLNLDDWIWAYEEPSGDSDKQWLIDPATDEEWLFKPLKPQRSRDEAASEYAASRIAGLLGVPAAHVEIGQWQGTMGCISANVVPDPTHALVDGAMFVSALVGNFDPKDRRSHGHRPEIIAQILEQFGPPAGFAGTALSAFAGYLVFDALIGNTDRHSRNWAVETRLSGTDLLAKSFDHATSLGISMRGPKRDQLLRDPSLVADFTRKATAHRFEGGRGTTLVRFAADFLADHAPETVPAWTERMITLDVSEVEGVMEASTMSEPGSRLALHVVRANRERIVECLRTL
ncbi:hypothetical protein F7P69_09510 [Cellulosimicrobium funkei]|nr:hypothetical protein [Cellulosimicrobium funkei]